MFKTGISYLLEIESKRSGLMIKRNSDVECLWDGTDFRPVKAIFVNKNVIQSFYPFNNRVKILAIREMPLD